MPPSYLTNSTIANQIIQFVLEGKKQNGQKIIIFDIKVDKVLFTYTSEKLLFKSRIKNSFNVPDNLFELD